MNPASDSSVSRSSSARKRAIALSGLLFLSVFGLVTAVYLQLGKPGTFDIRKKASEIKGAQLYIKAPSEVQVGQEFDLVITLDTGADPLYTISGADVILRDRFQPVVPPPPSCKAYPQCGAPPAPLTCPDGQIAFNPPRTDPCHCPPLPICVTKPEIGYQQSEMDRRSGATPDYYGKPNLIISSIIPGTIFESYPPLGDKISRQDTGVVGPPREVGAPLPSSVVQSREPLINDALDEPIAGRYTARIGNLVSISGVKDMKTDSEGKFLGFKGGGTFATIKLIALATGTHTFSFDFRDIGATDDTNITGFLKDQPVSGQIPSDRLLTPPTEFTIKVVNRSPSISPTPTCTPLPACAIEGVPDVNNPTRRVYCAVDLLPGQWSCPKPTETTVNWSTNWASFSARDFAIQLSDGTENGKTFRVNPSKPCNQTTGGMVCVSSNPPFRNANGLHYMTLEATWFENDVEMRMFIYLYSDGKRWWSDEIRVYNGEPSPNSDWIYFKGKFFDTPIGQAFTQSSQFVLSAPDPKKNNAPVQLRFSNINFEAFKNYLTPPPPPLTPTPTTPIVGVNLRTDFNSSVPVQVTLYAVEWPLGNKMRPIKLGTGLVKSGAITTIYLDSPLSTKKYFLYLETPSHLRKYQLDGEPIEIGVGLNPKNAKFVDFGSLTHGNLNGDTIINNLDVALMYAAWGQSIRAAGGFGNLIAKESPSVPADLNGDLTVNNRDLAILLGNFGAKAEDMPTYTTRPFGGNYRNTDGGTGNLGVPVQSGSGGGAKSPSPF